MLKIDQHIPIKDTVAYLAKFPRFSLYEKIPPIFFKSPQEGAIALAHHISERIREKAKQNKRFVLGLATGLSPLMTYKQLVRLHKEEGLSFTNVVTFQLDQYYPIAKEDPLSYNYFLKTNLYDLVDLPTQSIHSLSANLNKNDIPKFCEEYEKMIEESGGIDLQILGIGRSGHIGYNEPPSPANSRTRLVYLHRLTRKDAANLFRHIDKVPKCAITMGISTIKKAKEIIIMAWSENKAPIVLQSIEGEVTANHPVTFLHDHGNTTFYLDLESGAFLTRFKTPWMIKGDSEDPEIPRTKYWIVRSILWLSEKLNKPILRLTHQDYEDNGLLQLATDVAESNVENMNLFVYKVIREKITGWPLGDRPDSESFTKGKVIHKRSTISQKILIFSPHPDDDVISMGGTAHKLAKQGHHVSVAYMVPGSNAVHDYDAKKYLYFLDSFAGMKKQENAEKDLFYEQFSEKVSEGIKSIEKKAETQQRQDEFNIVDIKSLIRSSEAKIAVETFDIREQNTFCLNLPFYGSNKKKQPVSEKDYQIIRNLLRVTEPHVIYAAGDLTDPHGTHRKCLEIILEVVDQEYAKVAKDPHYKSLVPPPDRIFLYRGAWEQWDLALARHLVVMSPSEVEEKRIAILKHQSQKDAPMFPGDDSRQFWVRVKERNRNTAELLNRLGFADYEAVECFVDLNDLRDADEI